MMPYFCGRSGRVGEAESEKCGTGFVEGEVNVFLLSRTCPCVFLSSPSPSLKHFALLSLLHLLYIHLLHTSATTLKPLTCELNNIHYLVVKALGNFDNRQIGMTRRLRPSISKTAGLVECSWYAVVSTYQKWTKEEQKVHWRQGHGHPRVIDARGGGKGSLSGLIPQKSNCTLSV